MRKISRKRAVDAMLSGCVNGDFLRDKRRFRAARRRGSRLFAPRKTTCKMHPCTGDRRRERHIFVVAPGRREGDVVAGDHVKAGEVAHVPNRAAVRQGERPYFSNRFRRFQRSTKSANDRIKGPFRERKELPRGCQTDRPVFDGDSDRRERAVRFGDLVNLQHPGTLA
jgi:hypothetical protein